MWANRNQKHGAGTTKAERAGLSKCSWKTDLVLSVAMINSSQRTPATQHRQTEEEKHTQEARPKQQGHGYGCKYVISYI